MNFKSIALHSCLTFTTFVLALGCLPDSQVPQAAANTPQPEYRGKEPLDTADSDLELMGEDDHGSPADELRGLLLVALGNDDVGEANRLLQAGAEVNRPLNESGLTPVMAAKSLAMATLLCESGGRVQDRDPDGGTVLHYAVSRDAAPDLVHYFVARGADINARGWDNETPLFAAVTYFIERGPSSSAEVWTGGESASGAMDSEEPSAGEVIALLVELGADIDATDDYGNTVLMQCTVANDGKLVKTLLKLGADTGIRNKGGSTAREIAYDLGRRHIYQLLN